MPSERQTRCLQDIVDAIHRIQRHTEGMTLAAFEADEVKQLAVERLLQILTEAAHRLGREAPSICPGVNWRDVRDFGNFLRHEYDQILSRSVWETVQDDLPPLRLAIERALKKPQTSKHAESREEPLA